MSFASFLHRLTGAAAPRRPRTVARRPAFAPRLLPLEDRTLPSTYLVWSPFDGGPGSLRQAVLRANAHPGPDTVVFAPWLRGTLTLTGGPVNITDDLTVRGPGASRLTLSGNHASRAFRVSGGATDVTIRDLTIADGRASDTVFVGSQGPVTAGGAILNSGGHLTVARVTFRDNQADGRAPGFSALGGAVANLFGASLTVTDSRFTGNRAAGDYHGDGGAISNDAGSTLAVGGSTFRGNQATAAIGSPTGPGLEGIGSGGAIENTGGSRAAVSDSTFAGNLARGGTGTSGARGGQGEGGALHQTIESVFVPNAVSALAVEDSRFLDNRAVGGPGGTGGDGGDGGPGGSALGGAITNGSSVMAIRRSTFTDNQATAGPGGAGGPGGNGGSGAPGNGGAIDQTTSGGADLLPLLNVTQVALQGNRATGGAGGSGGAGGNGGAGGSGVGGGLINVNSGMLNLSQGLLLDNQATGGDGGAPGAGGPRGGNAGRAVGGGLASAAGAIAVLSDTTLLRNRVQGGAGAAGGNGGNALGGGIFSAGPSPADTVNLTLTRTVVVDNRADAGPGGVGGNPGLGQGGGLYVDPSGTACADAATVIAANHASTSDDDVFGDLGTPC
jgi:hypothetical protein